MAKVNGLDWRSVPCSLNSQRQEQVRFCMMLDHPNCLYLLGAKTSLDSGGISLSLSFSRSLSLFLSPGLSLSGSLALSLGQDLA